MKTISGVVKDSTGAPVPNISVTVLKSSAGTKTDELGRFTISAAVGSTLVFSSTTFETFETTVNERTEYNVSLLPKITSMTDVVVVGYGRQKKVNLVGAVGTVNFDEKMTARSVPNVSTALSGAVPGLSAVSTTGMAGRNGAQLLIRGLGTVNNSGPLVVVDGMPDVDINRLNMNDIETISVLKDATSASVYGSRAANGVILITTRSGKGMKNTAINFNSNTAVTIPTKSFGFMADYPRALTLHQRRAATNTLAANQLFKNGTIDQWMALGMIDPLKYPNTDWWDVILRNGTYQNYNVSASGGGEKSNFFVSVGLRDEEGLQINNDYKQYNARFNFDYKLRKNMNTGIRFNGNWSKFSYALEEGFTDPSPTNTAGTDMQYAIAGITPFDPASGYYGGVMAYSEDPQAYNPYTLYQNNLNNNNRQELNASMYYDWTPLKGLTATIDYNLNYYNQFGYTAFTPNQAYNFQQSAFGTRVYVGANAGIGNTTNTGYKTLLNARLNYATKIGDNHDLSAMAVYSEEYWYDRFQGTGRLNRLHPSLQEVDAALADPNGYSTSGNSSTEGLQSYIGRINYVGYGKYLLEGNFRVDGSSKFLDGNQYGFFPSVAAGWRFTEEKFISDFTDRFLSSGKLRVSYGALGNNFGVGRYEQQSTLTSTPYIIQNLVQRGFVNAKLINEMLSWEETSVFNIGLELGFFNNRLTAEVDWYDRLTTGMIRPSDLSLLLSGAYTPAPRKNIGEMRNRGIEMTLAWKDRSGDFNYGISVNGSYNATTLEQWNEYIGPGSTTADANNNAYNIFIGMPYNFTYGYEDAGIAQTWDEIYRATPQGAAPGDVLRKDINGDGRIDGNDRKPVDYTGQRDRPSTFGAINAFVSWKGFDLAILFQGATGRKEYWLNAYNNPNFGAQRYASTWDHWNKTWNYENRQAEWPRLGGNGNNTQPTTLWLEDMTYARMKNMQLGYSVPVKWLRKVHANSLRIAGSAENLFTLTNYRGLDPEKTGSGYNNNLYPINKSYALSIQLGF